MYNGIERELKVLVTKDIYEQIVKSYDFEKSRIQTNTYYDDENHTIKNMHGAMRIRTINNTHIFTLKLKKDEYTHYEFEKEINTNTIHDITDEEILGWFKEYHIPTNVYPIATFKTNRKIYEFENGELCADITIYPNHTDYEIEYEYTKEHDGIAFFNDLLSQFHMKYEKNCPSKIARAMND